MGLLDFVKDAGASIFGGGGPTDEERGAALTNQLISLGLGIKNPFVSVEDDVATVKGTAASQADREKAVLAVGNTEGIAQVDDLIEVEAAKVEAEAEPQATYYTVEKGDTLSKIAKAQYGDPMKYPVIFEANKPMLADPDKIYPGQVLRIPPQG